MQKANNHGDCFCTAIKRPAQKKKKNVGGESTDSGETVGIRSQIIQTRSK